MNAERLHAIGSAIQADLTATQTLQNVRRLVSALENLINQGGHPQFQTEVAQALDTLREGLARSQVDQFSPAWTETVREIGGSEILGKKLLAHIESIFARNTITQASAHEELESLQEKLGAFSTALTGLLAGFSGLNIGSEELAPGDCEIGVIVPRKFVQNKLDKLGDEFEELSKLFGVFAELATGTRGGFEVRTISSSDFMVYLQSTHVVCACIVVGVERIVALYRQLLEIRKLRGEIQLQGVKDSSLKGLDEHVNKHMESGIETVVKDLMQEFGNPKDGTGRNKELAIELKYSLKKIATRIDRGFNIEVRMSQIAPAEANDADNDAASDATRDYEKIKTAAAGLQYIKLDGEPILSLSDDKGAPQDDKKDKK